MSEFDGAAAATILIVEDEALVASLIQVILDEAGFRVVGVASSGIEALTLAGDRHPELALVDIKLAGPMDGIEVAQHLHTRFGTPAMFLSGVADPAIMARARSVPSLGFLEKPFRPSQVFNALQRALQRMPSR